MKVVNDIKRLKGKFVRPVLAIGIFDGVHRGHQYLLGRAVRKARAIKGASVVVTFFPHPEHVLKPGLFHPFIISLRHRLKLIEKAGIGVCIVIHFTKRFSNIHPDDFIKNYLVKFINPGEIFVGANFKFGKNRQGDVRLLQSAGRKYGFNVHAIHPVKDGPRKISSSLIRGFVAAGKIDGAQRVLGRPVSILGKVVVGDRRGKTLGFPTANIEPAQPVILPKGIYAVRALLGRKVFKGMLDIGWRPSFKRKKAKVSIEVHIFGFNKNIYGKEIEVQLIRKIRDEKKFASATLLIRQLKKDEEKARELCSR